MGCTVTLGRNEYLVAATNPDAVGGDECNNVIVRAEEINGRIAYLLPSFERVGD